MSLPAACWRRWTEGAGCPSRPRCERAPVRVYWTNLRSLQGHRSGRPPQLLCSEAGYTHSKRNRLQRGCAPAGGRRCSQGRPSSRRRTDAGAALRQAPRFSAQGSTRAVTGSSFRSPSWFSIREPAGAAMWAPPAPRLSGGLCLIPARSRWVSRPVAVRQRRLSARPPPTQLWVAGRRVLQLQTSAQLCALCGHAPVRTRRARPFFTPWMTVEAAPPQHCRVVPPLFGRMGKGARRGRSACTARPWR